MSGGGALSRAVQLTGNPFWVDALLVGGILLVTASLLMVLRNRKRRAGHAVSARDRLDHARDDTRQRDRQRKDLESVALSIEEMARRVAAQLDNKASRVEALLDEAERTLHRLEAATRVASAAADRMPAGAPATSGPRVDPPAEDLSTRVRRLAGEGLEPPAIAAQVDEHVGKVELILSLARE